MSLEEAFAAFIPGYPCCSFVGSLVAVDLASGDILWKSYMAPVGYSGNAIWGNAPAVDTKRSQVYVATGNNYSSPDSYKDCIDDAAADETAMHACNVPDNYFDSIVALDLATGATNWSQRVMPYDTWHVGCSPFLLVPPGDPVPPKINCDYNAGPDFDFGQGPILYRAKNHSNSRGKGDNGEGRNKGRIIVWWFAIAIVQGNIAVIAIPRDASLIARFPTLARKPERVRFSLKLCHHIVPSITF